MYSQTWNDEFQKNTAFIDRRSIMWACEIGSFEGLTSNYIVDKLLSHAGTLICVDPLESGYALDGDGSLFEGQYDRFVENTQENKSRIELIRKPSQKAIPILRDNLFQMVYIDGDHTYNSVYFDGTEAFRICAVGGYILFDDYNWGHDGAMKKGIERVLSENKNHRLLLKLNQVLVQKLEAERETEDGQDEYQDKSIERLFNEKTIHAAYCNLDERADRNEEMKTELERVGIYVERQRSFPWKELYDSYDDDMRQRVDVMFKRTPGAIGCHMSQVEVMKKAMEQGKHAIVLEDDLKFCDDFPSRLNIIYKFLNQHQWDIFWFGGTYHTEPTWHKSIEGKHIHPDMQVCNCTLNRDWEPTFNPYIVRTYGAFSTHAYLVNKDRISHVLELLDRNLHLSMGIDWIMLKEQPNLFTYAFNPGCIKQYDSYSNINNAFAKQSGFENLGPHWFYNIKDKY